MSVTVSIVMVVVHVSNCLPERRGTSLNAGARRASARGMPEGASRDGGDGPTPPRTEATTAGGYV